MSKFFEVTNVTKDCLENYIYWKGKYGNGVYEPHLELVKKKVKREFKVGDRVRRIKGEHGGMKLGNIGTVKSIPNFLIYLIEYSFGHDPNNLEIVKEKEVKTEERIKVGDTVEVLKDNANDSYWKKGEQFIVSNIDSFHNYHGAKKNLVSNFVKEEYLKLVESKAGWEKDFKFIGDLVKSKTEKTEEKIKMKKAISNNYVKTVNALLVEKHLASEITDNFIGGLIVKTYKTEILEEAKRREEESKKK